MFLHGRLYVILSGTVSVYVDGKMTGESGSAQQIRHVQQKVERVTSDVDEKKQRLEMCQ